MNPSAASYVPSFGLQRVLRHELPVTAQSAGPHPRAASEWAAAGVSPMVLPRETPTAASMPTPVLMAAASSSTAGGAAAATSSSSAAAPMAHALPGSTAGGSCDIPAAPLTAAARLRLLNPRHGAAGASGATSSRATPAASASATPVMHGRSTPVPQPLQHLQAHEMQQQGLRRPIRYTRAELLGLREPALDAIRRGPVADAPPFTRLPATFVPLLSLPFALEYVNVDAASALTEGAPRGSGNGGFIVTSSDTLPGLATSVPAALTSSMTPEVVTECLHLYHCAECAQGGPRPCAALATVLYNARRYVMTQPMGRWLLQSPAVVWGQLQLALVFEAKQSSLRLRTLAERAPSIRRLVGEYLYGEGYHLSLPAVTAHEEWRAAMQMLRFDAIRDNRTRVVTDLSKHWKKRHTQFEQFVFFFSFRDDVPLAGVKNMLTRSVKPGMVAMLSGDVVAMILLHNLGFFIPPDYYWTVFPFLEQALNHDTMTHDVVRHLGGYFSAKQDPNMHNPVTDPFTNYRS